MAISTRDTTWPFPGKRSDVKNLGKTVLQMEREQLAKLPNCSDCHDTGHTCVGFSGQADDGNAPVMERCASCGYGEQSPLSADECAIAVNDPNGCASWLRELADAIERGEHVGMRNIEVVIRDERSHVMCHIFSNQK